MAEKHDGTTSPMPANRLEKRRAKYATLVPVIFLCTCMDR